MADPDYVTEGIASGSLTPEEAANVMPLDPTPDGQTLIRIDRYWYLDDLYYHYVYEPA